MAPQFGTPLILMFDDIRPFHDDEVSTVLSRLFHDKELFDAVKTFRFGHWPGFLQALASPMIGMYLRWELRGVHTVADFQAIVARYMGHAVEETTDGFSVSGIENIPSDRACLFMGNHRDIALDPAFLSYALKKSGRPTCRVAIGDNLLSKAYVADLMRLNKCFIVKRSAKGPKAVLAAYKKLSRYIQQSIEIDGESAWIAQREGRAKDGDDRTEPAILKMLHMAVKKERSLTEHLQALCLVPVSISYEYDPCDAMKARELNALQRDGSYEKSEYEDIESIALGIKGDKGRVHVTFGEALAGTMDSAQEAAAAMDRAVIENYVLHSSNCIAYQKLHGDVPKVPCDTEGKLFNPANYTSEAAALERRLQGIDPALHEIVLQAYAKPVENRLALQAQC